MRYFGVGEWGEALVLYSECCDGGSVRDIIDGQRHALREDQAAFILADVLTGLERLHIRHQVLHRDLKASNVMLTGKLEVKLADYAVCSKFDTSTYRTMRLVGAPYWHAPEVIGGGRQGPAADVWSLGILAVELTEGVPPYAELQPARAMVEITFRGFPGYRNPDLHSHDFCSFVAACVRKEAAERASVAHLLGHPFIRRTRGLSRLEALRPLVPSAPEERDAGPPRVTFMFGEQADDEAWRAQAERWAAQMPWRSLAGPGEGAYTGGVARVDQKKPEAATRSPTLALAALIATLLLLVLAAFGPEGFTLVGLAALLANALLQWLKSRFAGDRPVLR
jgi:serine/threonine protein kinase